MFKNYDDNLLDKLKKAELDIYKDFAAVCEKYDLKQFAIFGTALGTVRHHGYIPWDDDIDLGMLRDDYEKLCKVLPNEFGDKYRISNPKTEQYYSSSVVKLQRNGTKFVPPYAVNAKTDLCLHIDIFIFDHLSDDPKKADQQIKKARILSMLMFLRYFPDPTIRQKGLLGTVLKTGCKFAHVLLALSHVSPKTLYTIFEDNATRYNGQKTKCCTTFSDTDIKGASIAYDDLFPLVPMQFEDTIMYLPNQYDKVLTNYYGDYMKLPPVEERVNHAPVIVQFPEDE